MGGGEFSGRFGLGVFFFVVLVQRLSLVAQEGHVQGLPKIIYLYIIG